VRYADDAVLAFERGADALALKARLEESLADCGLALNQAKTRLIRFGRHWPGRGIKPEIFDFLGFTHIVAKDRKGRYLVLRKTARKRFRRHLLKATAWLRKQRHQPLAWQWQKLRKHLLGYYRYYGIRGNYRALARYRWRLWRL
jgi:RNA-directed DNA polymerase